MSTPPRRRESRSFRSVAIGGAFLAALIVAVAASLYVRFIRYERVAARHVPPGSILAVRVEVEHALLYDPARRHVLPLLGSPGGPRAEGDARVSRLEERTGLKRSDLREILVARGATSGDWVVVLGGIFPRSGLALIAEALRSEDAAWEPSADGRVVVHRTQQLAVARAGDGAVLLGSSEPFVRAAIEPSGVDEALGLSRTGPGGFAIGSAGLHELSVWPRTLAEGELPALLGMLTRATGELSLGERVGLSLSLTDEGGGEAERLVDWGLEAARAIPADGSSRAEGLLRVAADRAHRAPRAGQTAQVELSWDREEVDQAFSLVAAAVRSRWAGR